MANYADATRTPRTLTEREQRLLLKVTGEHRAGYLLTADLLVDGIPYDFYTPTTSNANRIISAMRSKNSQARGIVLDLSKSGVALDDLGNVMGRLRGAGTENLQEIIILGR